MRIVITLALLVILSSCNASLKPLNEAKEKYGYLPERDALCTVYKYNGPRKSGEYLFDTYQQRVHKVLTTSFLSNNEVTRLNQASQDGVELKMCSSSVSLNGRKVRLSAMASFGKWSPEKKGFEFRISNRFSYLDMVTGSVFIKNNIEEIYSGYLEMQSSEDAEELIDSRKAVVVPGYSANAIANNYQFIIHGGNTPNGRMLNYEIFGTLLNERVYDYEKEGDSRPSSASSRDIVADMKISEVFIYDHIKRELLMHYVAE